MEDGNTILEVMNHRAYWAALRRHRYQTDKHTTHKLV